MKLLQMLENMLEERILKSFQLVGIVSGQISHMILLILNIGSEAFKNATLVVTDSFHGTVFALKNKKDFVILGRYDKVNKINNLLSGFDIKRKFYENNTSIDEYLSIDKLDYEIVNKKIDSCINSSIDYLKCLNDK